MPSKPYSVPVHTPISFTSLGRKVLAPVNCAQADYVDEPDLCNQRWGEGYHSAGENAIQHGKGDDTSGAALEGDPESPHDECRKDTEDDCHVVAASVIRGPSRKRATNH